MYKYVKAYRDRHKLLGLCRECSKKIYKCDCCEHHYNKTLLRIEKYRTPEHLQELNRCSCCISKLNPDCDQGYTTCINCREGIRKAGYILKKYPPIFMTETIN